MNDIRLRHDCAWSLASACVDRIGHLYRPEEQKDLHELLYKAAQAMLLYYTEHADLERQRLSPSSN